VSELEVSTLETPEDAGKGDKGRVARWLAEIESASKTEKTWREEDAKKAVERYRDEKGKKKNVFNILWSNVQVMKPSLYAQTPTPIVSRRFKDADPVGRALAEVIERALSYTTDQPGYDFDHTASLAVLDMLLPGRGIVRVRYEPTIDTITPRIEVSLSEYGPQRADTMESVEEYEADEQGAFVNGDPYDETVEQVVYCEAVQWDGFRRGPGKTWEDVSWIAFEHQMTRAELEDAFGEVGGEISLDIEIDSKEGDDSEIFKRARVWEIWDKDDREVLFIAPAHKEAPLKRESDPLGLTGFFPIPRPLMALETSDSLVPVTDYSQYENQAEELNLITSRINKIVDGLRLRGVYDSTMAELDRLFNEDDNTFVPAENAAQYVASGRKIEDGIWMMPIDRAAAVLRELYVQREALKQTIFEITGLSDIIRGASDPRETLGAQQIKAQTGSTRLRDRQREVQRFLRDLMRLKAEILAEHFEPAILAEMTGLPPELVASAVQIMRSDKLRGYRIDIETDSTIAADLAAEREQVTELLGGINQFLTGIGPAVQAGFVPMEVAKTLLLSAIRRFRMGREVEDALESIGNQPEGQPNPQAQAEAAQAQADQQALQMKQQVDAAKAQADMAQAQAQGQKVQSEAELAQVEHQTKMERLRMEAIENATAHQVKMARIQAEAQETEKAA